MKQQFARRLSQFILTTLLLGCVTKPAKEPTPVLVAAASDLTKVSQPLTQSFERASQMRVTFAFGASGQLEQQIRHGAPFDVFAPASRSYSQALQRDGFTDGADVPYGTGRLVAWSKTISIASLQDLAGPSVRRIALANPRYAPFGTAAQQALEKAGLWRAIEPKVVYSESAAHALEMAVTGNVDAAFVSMSLVHGAGGSLLAVDQSLYAPIEQAAVMLKDSKNKPAARAFVEFLRSAEAQRILQEYGLGHGEQPPQGSRK